jgi:hypothetical protein
MATRKLWPGAPGSEIPAPGPIPELEKREHPEVWINGTRYAWEPGEEDGVPAEALAVWERFLEGDS